MMKTQRIGNTVLMDYLLVLFVLILEVTVFFEAFNFPIPNLTTLIKFVILLFLFIKRSLHFNRNFLLFVLLVLLLILIQGLIFGFSIVTFLTYPAFTLFTPYFLYKVIGPRVFEYIVNVIFYTAILSSLIWLLQILVPPFNDLLQTIKYGDYIFAQGRIDPDRIDRVSLAFVYTIPPKNFEIFGIETCRNWGLYHEPGAFAYFLIIAIGINTIMKQNLFNWKNIVLSVILLTTFSTAGYLAFFLLVSPAIVYSKINPSLKVLIIPSILLLGIISYTQLDFMQDKMINQYEQEIDDDTVFEKGGGRIWRIRGALNLLSTSPIIGRGIILASRDFKLGSHYYFTGAEIWRTLASYGLLFAPIIYFIFYKGIKRLCISYNFRTSFALFFFLAIAIGATSQTFFMDNITMQFFMNGIIMTLYESSGQNTILSNQ